MMALQLGKGSVGFVISIKIVYIFMKLTDNDASM